MFKNTKEAKHNEFHQLGVELFKLNANSSNAASDSLSLTPLMTSTSAEKTCTNGLSLNDKIVMCSSMIGYCHYIEQTSNAIGFPPSEIEPIMRARTLIEQRLNEFGSSTITPVCSQSQVQEPKVLKALEVPKSPIVVEKKEASKEVVKEKIVRPKPAVVNLEPEKPLSSIAQRR